jgi:hypothetical protein
VSVNGNVVAHAFGPGFNRLLALGAEIRGAPPLLASALILEREIKVKLAQHGSGRMYPSRANKGRRTKWRAKGSKGKFKPILHQASAPGEPPAPDLADLLRSIGHEWQGGAAIRVGSGLQRAPPLEYGKVFSGPHGRRVLKARPFMRPGLAAALPKMRREGGRAIVAELQVRGHRVGR